MAPSPKCANFRARRCRGPIAPNRAATLHTPLDHVAGDPPDLVFQHERTVRGVAPARTSTASLISEYARAADADTRARVTTCASRATR